MTPLAHEIVKDSLLPAKQRRHDAVMKKLRLLDGMHFFECSAVRSAAEGLINSRSLSGVRERLGFLPASRVWFEFGIDLPTVNRIAMLAEDDGNGFARVTCVARALLGEIIVPAPSISFPLMEISGNDFRIHEARIPTSEDIRGAHAVLRAFYGLLAMINTPRVIMRRQHMPHRGLERQLVAQRGNVGTWPLQGWSELVLKVRPPDIDDDDHEAHLTGARALHFCRAHLRIRLGRLELVSAHWRGDPALGIKQTRYRLAA